MSAVLDLDEHRVWTPAELDRFLRDDIDWRRFEIVDGALVVSPHANSRHEQLVLTLGAVLLGARPAQYRAIAAAMVDLRPSYRVTDLTVVADHVVENAIDVVTPSDVLLAVEIESPSSVTTDRITKPAQYASAGIPHYWRLETDPLRLVTYRLVDGTYAEAGSWASGETTSITEPFRVSIDVATLLP